jgi:hypothetical protein
MTTRSKTKKRRQQRSAARRKAKLAPPVSTNLVNDWLKEWAEASGFAEAWSESERLGHPGPYEAWFDAYHGEQR